MDRSAHITSSSPRARASWLCPTPGDQARLVDNSPSVKTARTRVALVGGLGVIACSPWLGWLPVAIFLAATPPLLFNDRLMARSTHPERVAAGAQVFILGLILAGVAVSGGLHSPLLPWVALPIIAAAARFRFGVFLTAVGMTALVSLGVVLACSSGAFLHDPTPFIADVALLAGLVVLQQPVLDAESRWRRDAVLDALTGLLNRQGLDRRFAELAEQARLLGAPVSLVLFDIDQFKAVNDSHGHATGDDVLLSVADTLRSQLRSFELLYRLGGDELLLVLPGSNQDDAMRIAEESRRAVQLSRPAGLAITVSLGVCTADGEAIDLADMFAAADHALYESKAAGRNAVFGAAVKVGPELVAV